jgi:hypothetical protein
VSGQNDRRGKNLTGQLRILAGHSPLTRAVISRPADEPYFIILLLPLNELIKL